VRIAGEIGSASTSHRLLRSSVQVPSNQPLLEHAVPCFASHPIYYLLLEREWYSRVRHALKSQKAKTFFVIGHGSASQVIAVFGVFLTVSFCVLGESETVAKTLIIFIFMTRKPKPDYCGVLRTKKRSETPLANSKLLNMTARRSRSSRLRPTMSSAIAPPVSSYLFLLNPAAAKCTQSPLPKLAV
jgi:hypothetical protein